MKCGLVARMRKLAEGKPRTGNRRIRQSEENAAGGTGLAGLL